MVHGVKKHSNLENIDFCLYFKEWPKAIHLNPVTIKAGVNMKRSEICRNIKREFSVRIKIGWEHYQTVDPLKREPQVGRGLSGIHLLILHFKFQFAKSIKSSTFHIFLNLNYPFRKNMSFTKCPKITQKFT